MTDDAERWGAGDAEAWLAEHDSEYDESSEKWRHVKKTEELKHQRPSQEVANEDMDVARRRKRQGG
jgi:hypothetical protein